MKKVFSLLLLSILLLTPLCASISFAAVLDSVHMYYYKNSLHNHLETDQNEGNPSTNVGNWIARMSAQANPPKTATLGSVFGFFTQWTTPPRANNFHSEISTPHLAKWTSSWDGAENIDLVGFVPDNFDGQSFDPGDTTNMGDSYQRKLLSLIDEWETNAPNANRRYVVYAGWPNLNGYGGSNKDPLTITPAQFANWRAYGLGSYQKWMELLITRLQAARPSLNIRLHNINKAVLLCHENTVVGNIAPTTLFEDLAPHGRSTWYFLAAVAEYIELFGEKPPADFSFEAAWEVDTTVRVNYQTIVDYMWSVLSENVSVAPKDKMQPILQLYPNPANNQLMIKTTQPDFTIEIMDLFGQTVLKKHNVTTLQINHLPVGTYIVRLKGEAIIEQRKLLIN